MLPKCQARVIVCAAEAARADCQKSRHSVIVYAAENGKRKLPKSAGLGSSSSCASCRKGRGRSPSVRELPKGQARVAICARSANGAGAGRHLCAICRKGQTRGRHPCVRAAKRAGAGRGSPSVRALPKGQARVTILCARVLPKRAGVSCHLCASCQKGQARVREGHRLSLRGSILALVIASRWLRSSAVVAVVHLWRLGACRRSIVTLACDPVPLVRAILIIRGGGRSLG